MLSRLLILRVKIQVKHISIENIPKIVADRVNITIAIKYQVAFGLRLAYLDFTLANPKGQLDSWNGASPNIPNILTFLLSLISNDTMPKANSKNIFTAFNVTAILHLRPGWWIFSSYPAPNLVCAILYMSCSNGDQCKNGYNNDALFNALLKQTKSGYIIT